MKKNLVYIKTGGRGTISLIGGTRVSKTHICLEVRGMVDELNSHLGLLIVFLSDEHDKLSLQRAQGRPLMVGSYFATDHERTRLKEVNITTSEQVETIGRKIDRLDDTFSPLSVSVLPGGCRRTTVCHICRTAYRRAGRRILTLTEQANISSELLAYINRLSDYLFVLSRRMNQDEKKEEVFWNSSHK